MKHRMIMEKWQDPEIHYAKIYQEHGAVVIYGEVTHEAGQ